MEEDDYMKSKIRKHTVLLTALALCMVFAMMPAQTFAKSKEIQVVNHLGRTGTVSYNKKGLVTAVRGAYYTLKYSYTKSGKVRTVTEYEIGDPINKAVFKYKKGKICKVVFTDYTLGTKKTYSIKCDKYGRIKSIGSKCRFTYSKGVLSTAKAYYSVEKETVKYRCKLNKKNYLVKLLEDELKTGESEQYKHKYAYKKGNVVRIKNRDGKIDLTYKTIKVKKKYRKIVEAQRRDIQYYQIQRHVMNPIMYPAVWISDTELQNYYY